MQGVAGGSQGVVELVSASGSDTLRDIMGSAGFFVLEDIQDIHTGCWTSPAAALDGCKS